MFFDATLSEAEMALFERHVDNCLSCQKELERLANTSEKWQAAINALRPMANPSVQK